MTSSQPASRNERADDIALARRAGEPGGDQARREIVERLHDRVRAMVMYMTGRDRDGDDLVQIALIAILRSIATFRGESKLETWADRITFRMVKRSLARRARREAVVRPVESLPDPNTTPQDAAKWLMRRRLVEHLQKIPPKRRAAVILHWVNQYTIEEVAQLTDAPINTVRDRLRVAKKELRRLMLDDPELRRWALGEAG